MPGLRCSLVLTAALAFGFGGVALARHPSADPGAAKHAPRSAAKGNAGEYDYYVMSLSWSPTYCRTHPDERDQCGDQGYGFILHGLWPQYEGGGGPQRCDSDDAPDRKTVAGALAFMPSKRLINHEWRAHGACTGLAPRDYFGLADRAFAVVHVPPELRAPASDVEMSGNDLRAALRRANPGLRDDMMNLHCSQGRLAEIRFCLDKDLGLRACGRRLRNACPATATFSIPAAR